MNSFYKNYFLFGFLLMLISLPMLASFEPILCLNKKISFSPAKTDWPVFIISTEMSLKGAAPILQKAPAGLFISVGTERAFQGASLTDKATHALFIDYDEKIVRFNRINIELLKANTLPQYRTLRWDADFSAWQDFVNKNKRKKIALTKEDYDWWIANARDIMAVGNVRMEYINRYGQDVYYNNFIKVHDTVSSHAKSAKTSAKALYSPKDFSAWQKAGLILSEEDWQWWDRFIIHPSFWTATQGKSWLEKPSVAFDILSFRDLKSGNYLFDEKLYQRLHQMALKNHIAVCQLDIRDKEHIAKLAAVIEQAKIKISVADLDNIYMSGYVGTTNAYDDAVKELLRLGTDESVLLVMAPAMNFEAYFGFTFASIRDWPKEFSINKLAEDNHGDRAGLLHGRLFNGKDLPRWTKIEIN